MSEKKFEQRFLKNTLAIIIVITLISLIAVAFFMNKPNTPIDQGAADIILISPDSYREHSPSTIDSNTISSKNRKNEDINFKDGRQLEDFYYTHISGMTPWEFQQRVGFPDKIIGSGISIDIYEFNGGRITISYSDLFSSENVRFNMDVDGSPSNEFFLDQQEKILSLNDFQNMKEGLSMKEIVEEYGKPKRNDADKNGYYFKYQLTDGSTLQLQFWGEDYLHEAILQLNSGVIKLDTRENNILKYYSNL